MKFRIALFVFAFAMPGVPASAQQDPAGRSKLPELLAPVDSAKSAQLFGRNSDSLQKTLFFVRNNRYRIVRVNSELLRKPKSKFTITPFEGVSITVVGTDDASKSIDFEDPNILWTGEVISPSLPVRDFKNAETRDLNHRIDLDMSTWLRRNGGEEFEAATRRFPTNVPRSETNAIAPPNQGEIVRSVNGDIYLAGSKTTYRLRTLDRDFDYQIIYEVDDSKRLINTEGLNPNSEIGIEARRRADAYRLHVENIEVDSAREKAND